MGLYSINTGSPDFSGGLDRSAQSYFSTIVTPETSFDFETQFIPLPEHLKIIKVGRFEVFEYMPKEQVMYQVKRLADALRNIPGEDVINERGGSFLYKGVARFNDYKTKPTSIEVHRKKGGFGVEWKIKPPKRLWNKRVKMHDDIIDSGGTGESAMQFFDPYSIPAYLMTKDGIENQIRLRNQLVAFKIVKRWVGGAGMDLGIKGEGDTFRNYGGLVINPNENFSL